jgi:hypothetical protein
LESESNPEDGSDKFNRVDLLVRDSAGRRIIVEIQNQREADYLERLLYGSARVVVDSLKLGSDYRDVVKVVSVSILYFNYQASGMAEAEQKLTVMRMTPEERRRYERYITNLVIEKDVIETSWEEGLAQGLSKGRSEGRLEGRSEGRLEERREIALRLQAAGWTVEQIGEFFGQPIDDVHQWLNESP